MIVYSVSAVICFFVFYFHFIHFSANETSKQKKATWIHFISGSQDGLISI